jgi:DNA repair protein RecN (Recombination protein N)
MLAALSIRDVVLIEALDLEFTSGLSVLTGETGAGKSILLDGLGLALGQRADAGLVRRGASELGVVASFELPSGHPVYARLADNGVASDPGEAVILRRTVKADGGSRAFVNDRPVSAGLLREIGGMIVEIHGQHDDRGLLSPVGHRALLDAYGALDTAEVATMHRRWQAAQVALDAARADAEAANRDREWLEHAVAELTAFDAAEGEEEALADERSALQKGERLAGDLAGIQEIFEGSEGGLAVLRQAARRLDRIAAEDERLAAALAAIDRALIEAGEAEERLAEAVSAMTWDAARLETVENRLFELRALARKHRVEPTGLHGLTVELRERLDRLALGESGIKALADRARAEREGFVAAARVLGEGRRQAAARLDQAVAGEFVPLKLDAARFRTTVAPLPEAEWSAGGGDRVEFEIATNPGAPFAPLIKIASGGELSRFILAMKVAMAGEREAGTLVFDEIDRGVGGAVASAVGERLSRLARKTQVLVVTHSPQVAARGDRHFRISKANDGLVTRTSVQPLDDAERREEIARMLSGAAVTDEARAQAARLLEAA